VRYTAQQGIAMLNEEQTKAMQASFERIQRRPMSAPTVWGLCVGGPFDGLRARVEQSVVNNPEAVWGLGTMIESGCVVAIYEHDEKPGDWRFRGWDVPGSASSGAFESGHRNTNKC
jgi:hypothetical protein